MATELGVSIDELLFIDPRPAPGSRRHGPQGASLAAAVTGVLPADPVQRADDRKRIRLASGVVWERLTTSSTPNVDFIYVTYEVGGASSPEHEYQRHSGQEWGYIVSGKLGVTAGFDEYVLGPGDAISLDSTTPHRLYNLGSVPVHGIWFTLGRRPIELDLPGISALPADSEGRH